ncbi:helix-turn-helix domain-containing protein [Pseudoxanthomonas suwonensis]|uniref:HTH cro/C1-type domain-containing protein n=1 Tax=Pseudoxanthomonas suwonensis TaxID=314722 RepID=A0A0E3YZM3_9GAMM|nr:helix-turn-helix transcriptional regulator [Pseudoxanthomonas suwonensis]AKC85669.1 hypothetical protein WQ53_01695 [Pseudoxanthomonas suwonensis]
MELSMRIRIARQRARMSQEALALQLGVSRGAVANWECSMGALPTTSRLGRLAHATEVRFEWLATGRGPMAYQAEPEDIPALDAELVHDPDERRLLQAFRVADRHVRRVLLNITEAQLSASGKRSA